ncbi:MAG: ribonuclease H family protein [Solirubrobacteraceae bacterium]
MIYFNTDASYRDGWAGIAYDTNGLGRHRQLVPCASSSEAELLAVLLAMEVADTARLRSVVFRTDCEGTARPDRGRSRPLQPLRERVSRLLGERPGWKLELVPRRENVLANGFARGALKALSEDSATVPGHGSVLASFARCASQPPSEESVTVTVNSIVAAALIARAGIPMNLDGRWRLSEKDEAAGMNAALSVALVLLASGAPSAQTPAGTSIEDRASTGQ